MADRINAEDEKPRCRLYLITPASLTCDAEALAAFGETLAAALDAGDVSCVQLRLKDVTDDDWRCATLALMPKPGAAAIALFKLETKLIEL